MALFQPKMISQSKDSASKVVWDISPKLPLHIQHGVCSINPALVFWWLKSQRFVESTYQEDRTLPLLSWGSEHGAYREVRLVQRAWGGRNKLWKGWNSWRKQLGLWHFMSRSSSFRTAGDVILQSGKSKWWCSSQLVHESQLHHNRLAKAHRDH